MWPKCTHGNWDRTFNYSPSSPEGHYPRLVIQQQGPVLNMRAPLSPRSCQSRGVEHSSRKVPKRLTACPRSPVGYWLLVAHFCPLSEQEFFDLCVGLCWCLEEIHTRRVLSFSEGCNSLSVSLPPCFVSAGCPIPWGGRSEKARQRAVTELLMMCLELTE